MYTGIEGRGIISKDAYMYTKNVSVANMWTILLQMLNVCMYVCMYIYLDPFKCYTLNNSTNTNVVIEILQWIWACLSKS